MLFIIERPPLEYNQKLRKRRSSARREKKNNRRKKRARDENALLFERRYDTERRVGQRDSDDGVNSN